MIVPGPFSGDGLSQDRDEQEKEEEEEEEGDDDKEEEEEEEEVDGGMSTCRTEGICRGRYFVGGQRRRPLPSFFFLFFL